MTTPGQEVFIIGGGPSLKGMDFDQLYGRDTIAVNHSFFDIKNPTYFITMDYFWLTKAGVQCHSTNWPHRHQFEATPTKKFFILGFSPPRLEYQGYKLFLDTEYNKLYDLGLFDEIIVASGYGGIGTWCGDFRCGSDSGYTALQLAVVLGYKKIYLLGMDFVIQHGQTHYRNDCLKNPKLYEPKLNEFVTPYTRAFEDINNKTDCEVICCSDISRLKEYIPYKSLEEVLK